MQPNLFDLLDGIVIVSGGMIGAKSGFGILGYPGGAVGGLLGAMLGFFVAYTFDRLLNVLMVRSVRRKSAPALRAKLNDEITPGTYVSGLIISELLERGEPADGFRDYIFRQLHSEHVTYRKAGLYNLEICCPELAAKLKGFNPFQPSNEDLERLTEIESMSPSVFSRREQG